MEAPRIYGCTPTGVRRKMTDLFTANYPELLEALDKHVEAGYGFLYWTGPSIEIRVRDRTKDTWSILDHEQVNKCRPMLDFVDSRTFWSGPFDVRRPSPTPRYKVKQEAGAKSDLDHDQTHIVSHPGTPSMEATTEVAGPSAMNGDSLVIPNEQMDQEMGGNPTAINPALVIAETPLVEPSTGSKRSAPSKFMTDQYH